MENILKKYNIYINILYLYIEQGLLLVKACEWLINSIFLYLII